VVRNQNVLSDVLRHISDKRKKKYIENIGGGMSYQKHIILKCSQYSDYAMGWIDRDLNPKCSIRFIFSKMSRLALRSTCPPIEEVFFPQGGKQPECEVNLHSVPM
jgi:hypothetical protein